MSRTLLIGALALTLSLPLQATTGTAEFNQSYQAYQQAVSSGDQKAARKHARAAYELGGKIYARDSLDYANLGLNLANLLDFMDGEEAVAILERSLTIYEQAYGEQGQQLLDIYLPLMKLDSRKSKSHMHTILEIGEQAYGDDSLAYADLLLQVSRLCMRNHDLARSGRGLATEALSIIEEKAERQTMERVEAEYLNGIWAQAFKRRNKAMAHFSTVLELLEVLDYSHPYALASHTRLVPLLEKSARSDEATAHCLAIAQMRPWDDNQEQVPLHREAPEWPLSAIKRSMEGTVEMEFTIDKSGFVKDVEVKRFEGSNQFVQPAVEAMKKWRYAPKFIDGKPVEARSDAEMSFKITTRGG